MDEGPTTIPLFQCNDPLGCVDIAAGESIHIAWMQVTSGPFGLLGQSNVRGVQVALEEIGFEVLGHPIQWDGVDSLCTVEGGEAAAEQLAADPSIVAIIGPTCAPEAQGGLPLLSDAGFVTLSPSITHPEFTDPNSLNHYPGFIRIAHNDVIQGQIAAEYTFNQLGLTTAAIIADESLYSRAISESFAETFTALGGQITAQANLTTGETEVVQTLAEMAAADPQAIFFPVFEPLGASIASQKCGVQGSQGTQMVGTDSLLTSTFPIKAGECSIGTALVGAYVDPASQPQFFSMYADAFGEGPSSPFATHAYDAMRLALAAIEAVAVPEADGSLHIPRQALRDQIMATSGFNGITGSLTCNSNGDCASGQALAVFQITGENVSGSVDLLTNSPVWTANR
ncbi:MAG: branched-chain amino acid ABC transporter substrate-binding protein [Anaerolineales bacterium]